MRSPVAGSREECVAGQQTGAGLPHTRRETATAVQTEEQKKPNKSLEPRDFDTRVHRKSATRGEKCTFTSFPLALVLRNRSPTHCPLVSTTLQPRTPVRPLQTRFPAPRVEPLRVSSTKVRLAPYALLLTPPSQIPAYHHLIHRIITLKTGKMPRETVFSKINWADSENSGHFVSLTVKLLPESCEVAVGVTLETERTRIPTLVLDASKESSNHSVTQHSKECLPQTLSFSLSRTGSDCTTEVSACKRLRTPFACVVSPLHHCAHQARSLTQ